MALTDIKFYTFSPASVRDVAPTGEPAFRTNSRDCQLFTDNKCPDQTLSVQRCGDCRFASEDHKKLARTGITLYTASTSPSRVTQVRGDFNVLWTLEHNDSKVTIISEVSESSDTPESSLINRGGRRR